MSWAAVRAWRGLLRALDPTPHVPHLSPEGAHEAWRAALGALDDTSLLEVGALGGRPYPEAAFVAASTVFTAPIEWLAVLLGRGTHVVLKHPAEDPGIAPLLRDAANAVGLPLRITAERDVVSRAPLVVVMGSDDTVREVRGAARADARVLPHGHRISLGWVAEDDDASWMGLAEDAALYDGRGCLSPAAVFTPLPLGLAVERLAAAMASVQTRLPTGTRSPGEGARIREREALAKVLGQVASGPGWSVHGLPLSSWQAAALPRSVAVVSCSHAEALARIGGLPVSTVGTISDADPWFQVGVTRVCAPGRMQRPPLVRTHDGEDWLRATAWWPATS